MGTQSWGMRTAVPHEPLSRALQFTLIIFIDASNNKLKLQSSNKNIKKVK